MNRMSVYARSTALVLVAAILLVAVAQRPGPSHAQVVSPPKVVPPIVTRPVTGPMPVPTIIPVLPFPYTCDMSFPAMAQPPACTPILETVYVPGPPSRVVSVGWNGSVDVSTGWIKAESLGTLLWIPAVLPTSSFVIRARAPAPTQMIVLINGQLLTMLAPNVQPTPAQALAGYYSTTIQPLPTPGPPTAWAFWQINVVLPPQLRGTVNPQSLPQYTLTLRDVSLGAFSGALKQASDLTIPINTPLNQAQPSAVFLSGDNAKNGTLIQSAVTGIVARDVTVAGWAFGGPDELAATEEDVHFSILLDPDFIARNYAPDAAQLTNPPLPGQPNDQICLANCLTSLPFNFTSPTPNVAAFLLAGNQPLESDYLTVETNAWHISKRGWPPTGYFYTGAAKPFALDPPPPGAAYSADDAWAIHPLNGTQWPAGALPHQIAQGDYLIVTGTLWQDSDHARGKDPLSNANACFDQLFHAQAGWLEIHPADVVRFTSPPPPLHKRVYAVSGCTPNANGLTGFTNVLRPAPLDPTGVTAPPNYLLVYQEIVDPRFTDPNPANMTKRVELTCDPADGLYSALLVGIEEHNPAGAGYFNSVYTLWWEQSTGGAIRAPCPRIMLPTLRISNQAPPTLTATFVDQVTKAPLPGVAVNVYDSFWRSQASRTTGADGTVQLPFTPCPAGGAAQGTPPACRVSALRADYYAPVNLWTPALVSSNTMPLPNTIAVRVSDGMKGNAVSGATATIVDSHGQALVTATTASDGSTRLTIPTCPAFSTCAQAAGVTASMTGYLTCSMPIATYLGDKEVCH